MKQEGTLSFSNARCLLRHPGDKKYIKQRMLVGDSETFAASTHSMASQAHAGSSSTPFSSIPEVPREPYTGPDKITALPNELLLRIFSLLHGVGEAKRHDKADLRAINSTRHPGLCRAVKEELFRFMLLSFSYERDYDAQGVWKWKNPRLAQVLDSDPSLERFVKGVRVQIFPAPEASRTDHLLVSRLQNWSHVESYNFLNDWERAVQQGDSAIVSRPTFSYVDEPNTNTTPSPNFQVENVGVHQDDLFWHLFGSLTHNGYQAGHDPQGGRAYNCRVRDIGTFVFHILHSTRHLLPRLAHIEHIEPGPWPALPNWNPYGLRAATDCGTAIAIALVMKTAPVSQIKSLAFHNLPPSANHVRECIQAHSIRFIARRLEFCGDFLTDLDLSIDYTRKWPFKKIYPAEAEFAERYRWPDPMTFWAEMLNHLSNLRTLRIHDAREWYEDRKEQNLDLDMICRLVFMPSVRVLSLSDWAVTMEILTEKMPAAFPGLKVLEMEGLDMRSNEKDPWATALGMVKKRYGEIEVGRLEGLRVRKFKGQDGAYEKKRARKQVAVQRKVANVWDTVAKEVDAEREKKVFDE